MGTIGLFVILFLLFKFILFLCTDKTIGLTFLYMCLYVAIGIFLNPIMLIIYAFIYNMYSIKERGH